MPKGTSYWLSQIEFRKVHVTEYLGLRPKGTCFWLSRIEFQNVPATDYLGLNSKRYLFLTTSDWISKRQLILTTSDWIPKGTFYWLSRIEFQKVPATVHLQISLKRYLEDKKYYSNLIEFKDWPPKKNITTHILKREKVPARYLPGNFPNFMPGIWKNKFWQLWVRQ